MVYTETILSPRFCNTSPLAEIYFRPARDPSDSLMGTHGAMSDGATDSAAPLSNRCSPTQVVQGNVAPQSPSRPADPNHTNPRSIRRRSSSAHHYAVQGGEVHEDELPPVVMEHDHSCCQALRSSAPSCPPARRSRCTRQGRGSRTDSCCSPPVVLASTGTSDFRRLLGHVEVHQGRDVHRLSCLGFVRVQPAHVEDRRLCLLTVVPPFWVRTRLSSLHIVVHAPLLPVVDHLPHAPFRIQQFPARSSKCCFSSFTRCSCESSPKLSVRSINSWSESVSI